MISPFVTNVVIKIANEEVRMHNALREVLKNTTDEERRAAIEKRVQESRTSAVFFTKFAEARLIEHAREHDL